jgi:type I restriction enzyme, S subunit
MSFKKIGPYIREVDNRNTDSKVTLLRGVSTRKVLIESVANMTNVSLHNYKIAKKGQFVYVADTSRRGEKIAIALNDEETCIVSSIYTVFETDQNYLLPEYLFIWFNRSEFDRYARFNSWGSARETFNWDDLCNVEIPIPDIGEQRKYVALYKGLLTNQKVYENSLDDLQLICDTYIEDLIKKEPLKRLGEYIESVNCRNDEDINFPVQGVSNTRVFIDTRAKTQGINFSNYKIVKKGQFAYNPSRLNIGSIALRKDETCIVSPMYVVFEVSNEEELIPEYLNLWFARDAFCDYVWFHAFGSVRDTFDYNLMEDVHLPIPSIEKQKAVVTIYHTLETRKRINEQLKESIKPLCPVLMKGVVEGMEVETEKEVI